MTGRRKNFQFVQKLTLQSTSHLDDRRAPSFLRALRKPESISEQHWQFQNNLLQPRLESDLLVYTAKRPFRVDEAPAWWLCFDALQTVDRELREVDRLLADLNKPRFVARGVAKVENPQRLMSVIKTEGWIPVDARVKVSDVAALAYHIGGEQLYGNDRVVPLRELIQNASDAVRARRLLQGRPDDWGDVYVRLGEDSDGHWLEVEDNGVGMSVDVLTGPLLDFGTSYWGSPLMFKEFPGLLAKGFHATGQYGIGFFSVFMWGERVRVTTLRYGDALQDTRVLEFGAGLSSRPILREAREQERLAEGGTCVRVWLKQPPDSARGLLSGRVRRNKKHKLEDLCAWLCPSIDVNIYVAHKQERPMKVVSASDWITMDGRELLNRVWVEDEDLPSDEDLSICTDNLRLLRDSSGEVVGRASIFLQKSENRKVPHDGVITVGGFRTSEVSSIAGVLIGHPTSATRDSAFPIVDNSELARWASEQADLVLKFTSDEKQHVSPEYAGMIGTCGGNTGKLPVALSAQGWMNIQEVEDLANQCDEVLLGDHYALLNERERAKKTQLDKGVLVVTRGLYSRYSRGGLLKPSSTSFNRINWPNLEAFGEDALQEFNLDPLEVAIIEALSKGWASSLKEVLRSSNFKASERVIGRRDKEPVKLKVNVVVRNPKRVQTA